MPSMKIAMCVWRPGWTPISANRWNRMPSARLCCTGCESRMRWIQPESLDDGHDEAVSQQRVRIAIRVRLQSDLFKSRLNGSKLSGPAATYVFIISRQSVLSTHSTLLGADARVQCRQEARRTSAVQRLEPFAMPSACNLSGGLRSPSAIPAGCIRLRCQARPNHQVTFEQALQY